MADLSAKAERFCQLYARSLHGTQSHIDAGFTAKSRNAHSQAAGKLLTNPDIQARVDVLQKQHMRHITPDPILKDLAILVQADPKKVLAMRTKDDFDALNLYERKLIQRLEWSPPVNGQSIVSKVALVDTTKYLDRLITLAKWSRDDDLADDVADRIRAVLAADPNAERFRE